MLARKQSRVGSSGLRDGVQGAELSHCEHDLLWTLLTSS